MFSFIKKANAKFHLKYICPHCPIQTRKTRDLKHTGKCYWNQSWKKGIYDSIPMWMGFSNFFRLYVLRKPIRVCIQNRVLEGSNI